MTSADHHSVNFVYRRFVYRRFNFAFYLYMGPAAIFISDMRTYLIPLFVVDHGVDVFVVIAADIVLFFLMLIQPVEISWVKKKILFIFRQPSFSRGRSPLRQRRS